MKVLVTGANGFVGKAIVEELSEKEAKNAFQIYKLLKLNSKNSKSEFVEDKINVFRADISDYENVKNVLKTASIDVVIHSAGLAHQFGKQEWEDFWKINVQGTENIAKLAVQLNIKHFILISSVSVYGASQEEQNGVDSEIIANGISEEADCSPRGFYAQSKLESEKIAVRICEENKIALTILRPATVIGEEDKGNVARLIRAIDKRRFIWIGDGENFKSLIYKRDVARACLSVIGKTEGTEIFNVTAEPVKMSEIVSEISLNLGIKPPKLRISPTLLKNIFRLNSKFTKIKKLYNLAETVNKWLSDDVFSGEKFKRVYNFQAETPIKEAIKWQAETYKKLK